MKSHADISKFLSYVLRHQPESIGLQLDTEGWAAVNDLITLAGKAGTPLTPALIEAVVRDNDKQRFALTEDKLHIRAVQGHSTNQVAMTWAEKQPPQTLWHGTATRFINSIRAQGLVAGSRHHVHLSGDEVTAMSVGKRHGKPVVLKIRAGAMHQQGFAFYQAENGVWLTLAVPAAFIDFSAAE
ncbi:RNA:NAD 2'-phosphotransferase [Cronobacter condimenti 1330]|uniref:Probable RNA 2'-phosphotransferase n=1 Tax=Cronobacter condimenti 1330 TaxID=1073999 RepID=K7ZYX2_9ENTR|nr:RNA 2'-phosphotransferase [Cronobacter condimenti]ALB63939.1 RNA 2'-phosphotransferase [Cronobacter condimenti 1330]CCJ71883.1 RNA:NAD 2'-phosphotransferase [Cronobacter condimenti 1330]